MMHFSRYFLIGILVSGLAVDHAAARRLFQRRDCSCRCHTVCAQACSSVCPTSSPCDCIDSNLDSEIVADSPCAPAAPFFAAASACQTCESEALPGYIPEGYIPELVPELVPEYASSFTPDYMPDSSPSYVGEERFEATPAPTEWSEPTQEYTEGYTEEYTEEYTPAEVTESPLFESPADPPASQPISPPTNAATPEINELLPPAAAPLPKPEATEPAVEPSATEPPAAGVGDRYSNSSPVPTPADPIEPPAIDDDPNNLFDEPISPPTEDKKPIVPEPQPDSDVDNLFGPLESSEADEFTETSYVPKPDATQEEIAPATIPTPAEPTPAEPDPADSDEGLDPLGEDPFGDDFSMNLKDLPAVLQEAGGLQSVADRTWTDNTAKFECEARLVRVTAKNVVLLQSTGGKLTVPFSRLAKADLHFVHEQIAALRVVHAHNAAAEKLAVAWGK